MLYYAVPCRAVSAYLTDARADVRTDTRAVHPFNRAVARALPTGAVHLAGAGASSDPEETVNNSDRDRSQRPTYVRAASAHLPPSHPT